MRIRRLFALLALPACAVAQPVPTAKPFAEELAPPVIVVAKLSPGGEYPRNAECSKPEAICLNPPSYWLEARNVSTVHGEATPVHFTLSSRDHYGLGQYKDDGRTWLLLLKRDGETFMMARYARKVLVESKSGVLYLPIRKPREVSWLPCTVDELREEIQESDFHEDGVTELELLNGAERPPTLFRPTRKGTMPRYAISVPRLAEHLSKIASEGGALTCERAAK